MTQKLSIRALIDGDSQTRTFLLVDEATGKAALIDPVLEQAERDLKLVEELGVTLELIIETHVHADHITAAKTLQGQTGAQIVYGKESGVTNADILIGDGDTIKLGATEIKALSTPGHTDGCTSYYIPSEKTVFTGDALLYRKCGRSDFQQGSPDTLYDSVHQKLFTLPDDTIVYPGHDYDGFMQSTIGEEKKHNALLNTALTKPEAVQKMIAVNQSLSQPKKIALAVPANLNAGEIEVTGTTAPGRKPD